MAKFNRKQIQQKREIFSLKIEWCEVEINQCTKLNWFFEKITFYLHNTLHNTCILWERDNWENEYHNVNQGEHIIICYSENLWKNKKYLKNVTKKNQR